MAYRIEGKDIVVSGFESGIADTPYSGIADMRNIDIISVPGEAAVNFSEVAAAKPPAFNAVAYTAQNAGDTITVSSTTGLYPGVAIVLAGNTATGISNGVVYYVGNITATTFQLFIGATLGSAIAITSDGTGTLTTYQYGNQRAVGGSIAPVARFVQSATLSSQGRNGVYLTDASNYAWVILPSASGNIPANSLIFLGNIGGVGASTVPGSGIAIWNGYLILLGGDAGFFSTLDYAPIITLFSSGPAAAWAYAWETISPIQMGGINNRISTLVSAEDGNLYFTTNAGLGSLSETPGDTFDPSDPTSYTLTGDAVALPEYDKSTCIAELGSVLLIGARGSFVYVWDKISIGFSTLLNIPDKMVINIVATSQNAYVFAGRRGRIYITNGSGIDLFKKIPDYVTGTYSPYITWWDASFSKNQLNFSFTGSTNADAALTTVAGAWSIDLETDALRMVNKPTNSGYGGTVSMVVEMPIGATNTGVTNAPILGDNQSGSGMVIGWWNGTSTYGVDVGSSTPYTSYESYIQTDMIPVGTYLDKFTPSQIEWKTSVPLGGNGTAESIRISYRQNLNDSFTLVGSTTATGTSVVGSTTLTTTGSYAVSDYYQVNFEKVQWVQLLVEMSSNATTPTYNRLTEVRIRDWPSGKNAKG